MGPSHVAVLDVVDRTVPLDSPTLARWSQWLTGPSFGAGLKVHDAKWLPDEVSTCPSAFFVMGSPVVALLPVPSSPRQYLDLVGPKTRNMISKARRRLYNYSRFVWNEHLTDIHKINTSKSERQGKPMSPAYQNFPVHSSEASHVARIGIFSDQALVAYANCVRLNQLSVINTIIGHADHLTHGVMNLLIYGIVAEFIETDVTHINYLTLSPNSSLSSFKRRVGFKPHTCFIRRNPHCANIQG